MPPLSHFHAASGSGSEPPLLRVPPPGPVAQAWLRRLQRAEAPICFDTPTDDAAETLTGIVYASGRGSNVLDVDGNRYVDLAAGFGAMLLGHLPEATSQALQAQSQRLWAGLGDLYASDAKIELLERVAACFPAPGARVLLCQSGSDAVTAALKTAALNTGHPGVLSMQGAYHGLGFGPLAACGYKPSFREPFRRQLNQHVTFAPYPHDQHQLDGALQAARDALQAGGIGAVLVEPILGRGGCVEPPAAFLPELARLAKQAGAMLIADEIWTGLGRSGAMLACQKVGVVPDILCLGKGLGGGLPLSACVASDAVMQAWWRTPGVVHTSTFQGNALACATGLAVLRAVEQLDLASRARDAGALLQAAARAALDGRPGFDKVTGAGLMVGIALASGALASRVCAALLARGFIVVTGGARGEVLTITPALTIAPALLELFVQALAEVLETLA